MRLLTGLLLLSLAACTGGGAVDDSGNHYPEVLAWACTPQTGDAPLTPTCAWQIRDLDDEGIKCTIDVGGDGTIDATYDDCPFEGGQQFTLSTIGANVVFLNLTDARGLTATSGFTVDVTAPPNTQPSIIAFAANPLTGGVPLEVTLSFGAVDADGDALSARVLDGDQVVAAPSACGSNETRKVTLSTIGKHVLTLEVTDLKGGKDTRDVSIDVTALPQIGDLRLTKVEWGQTVMSQTPRLVAGKDVLLRAYVLSERTGVTGVSVKVEATQGSTPLGELMLMGPAYAPVSENPNDLTQQWRVTLPAAWVVPGLSVRVRVDPSNTLGETSEANNELTVAPAVGAGNVLPVTHVPIVQSGRTGTARNIDQAMKQIWPVKGIDNKSRAAYTFSGVISANGSGWDTLLDQLDTIRQNDGSRRDYLGWISVTYGSGVAGLGYVGFGAALSRDDEVSTAVHELGHNMGREHAPCGGASDPDTHYPVSNAHLDAQGYDYVSGRVLAAASNYDVMSYCDPIWVSRYNYNAVQGWLETHPVPASAALTAAMRVVVSGQVKKGGGVTLHPLTLIAGPADAVNEPGDWLLTLHGDRTVSIPFAVKPVADGLDEAHFSLLAPEVPGLYAAEISYAGKVVAVRVAGPARAKQQASVRSVPGGVELSWDAAAFPYASIAHVGDEGHTTLSLWAEGGRAFVSTEGLADGGAFEVSLSDGVQSQRLLLAR